MDLIEKINIKSWADWDLDKLEVDYECIIISLSEASQGSVAIVCKDYIGFSFVGHWDESVIEDIKIDIKGTLIDDSLCVIKELYGENPIRGGGIKNFDDKWYQLSIQLIDGNIMKIACKDFKLEKGV